jgi:hypothetical protein
MVNSGEWGCDDVNVVAATARHQSLATKRREAGISRHPARRIAP